MALSTKELKKQVALLRKRAELITNETKVIDMTWKERMYDILDTFFTCADKKELWMAYPNNPDYMVSDEGRVKSLKYNKETILSPTTDGKGYKMVALWTNGVKKPIRVHRLVAETFLPNPYNKPQVNHLDEDKGNNKLSNLEWATNRENKAMSLSKDKTKSSQYIGVSYVKARRKYVSSIVFNGKVYFLGYHEEEFDAYQAYQSFMMANNIENKYAV